MAVEDLIILASDPRPGIEVLLAVARGEITDNLEIIHGAIHIATYALRVAGHNHDPLPMRASGPLPGTVLECCQKVEALFAAHRATVGVGAVNWALLLTQLLPLVFKIVDIIKDSQVPEVS